MSDKSSFESLIDSTQAYTKTTLEIAKLKGINSTTKLISVLVARFFLYVTIIIFMVITSIGIALLISEQLGKPYYGFFIVAGIYFILAILFYFFLPKLVKGPLSDLIISEILE